MKKFFKNILVGIKIFWYSLFYGMESANKMMTNQNGDMSDNGIHQNVSKGGVMEDLLEQRVTKEVEELREKHYRIIKEADKYDPKTIVMTFDEDGNPVFSNTDHILKKTYADFMKHPPVYETDDTQLRTIQDNKIFEKETSIGNIKVPNGLYDYDTTLSVKRGDILPRIEIDKFVTKIVVRKKQDINRAFVDFYLPTSASQFGKIDAILVSNLYTMFETKNYRSDLTEFEEIEWYSDKAWNSDDMCLFKYDDINLVDINVFDGSFVFTFDCHIVSDGESIVEKYMTEEMEEKYKNLEPKTNTLDLMTGRGSLERRDEKLKEKEINLENKIIKL